MLIIILDNHDTLLKEARARCIGIEVSDKPAHHKSKGNICGWPLPDIWCPLNLDWSFFRLNDFQLGMWYFRRSGMPIANMDPLYIQFGWYAGPSPFPNRFLHTRRGLKIPRI